MTNFIPIFPLALVVYPGEDLNLHIFEPRYKQLIAECYEQKKPFGLPAIIEDKLQEYGTLMQVVEITNVHQSGELDIKTRGEKVFRILEVVKEIPEKLYSGAIVNYPSNHTTGSYKVMRLLISSIRELHKMLGISKEFGKADDDLLTYDVAHHIGLSVPQEYELLNLVNERQRQEYIRLHLAKVIPMVVQMEGLKEKIKLNGHFKNLASFNFDI